MRACPDCGEPEQRQIKGGRELLNLDPVSGRCVPCLVKLVEALHSVVKAMPRLPRDWQKAASGERDEELS
jgi:hypothetical protein